MNSNRTSSPKVLFNKTWHRVCFLAWLPWFLLSLPWQVQKAYAQFRYAIDFNSNQPDAAANPDNLPHITGMTKKINKVSK